MRPSGNVIKGLFVAWVGLIGVGSGAADFLHPAGTPEADRFRFHLQSPQVVFVSAPTGTKVDAPGLRLKARAAGVPDIPTHKFLVAIPPGATPRLILHRRDEAVRPGLRPLPVPTVRHRVSAAAAHERHPRFPGSIRPEKIDRIETLEEAAEVYAGTRSYPERVAWLGETGVLHDQRYVELHWAPVRYDPRLGDGIGGLRHTTSIEVEVVFDGATPAPGIPRRDSPFEGLYRETFANYAQGSTFRVTTGDVIEDGGASASGPEMLTGPSREILVRDNGLIRLDFNRMQGTGFESEPLSTWRLSSGNVEVPLLVHDADMDDTLDATDWVQFYGQALDFEPETELNADTGGNDIFAMRDFDDENHYMLRTDAGPNLRLGLTDAAPPPPGSEPASFTDTARAEEDSAWRPLGAADPWYWSPSNSTGGTPSRTETVPLPGLAGGTTSATVRVHLRGITEDPDLFPDHKTRITLLNGSDQLLATHDDDGTFDGRTLYLHEFTWNWPGSGPQLTDPVKVQFEVLQASGTDHTVILDWIEVDYQRTFQAAGDALTVHWPDGDAEFEVTGFTSSNVQAWEITGEVGSSGLRDPRPLDNLSISGAGPFDVRFRMDNDPGVTDGDTRTFVLQGDGALTVPANPDFLADTFSTHRDTAVQADLIVLGPSDLLDQSGGSPLTQLLNLRASQGITSRVVALEDAEDDFYDGRTGPLAIENFLTWVMSTTPGEGWAAPKPTMLLLIGDGSFDYKGGRPRGNYTPTQILFKDDPSLGYFTTDNRMAAVVGGDLLADLVVGRLTARSVTEANDMLQKVLDYEQSAPAGPWRRHAIFVSDRGKDDGTGIDVFESTEFERINAIGRDKMKRPPHTEKTLRYYSDYIVPMVPLPNEAINQDIKDAVNGLDGFDGAAMLQFKGHGNFDLWSDDVIFCGNDGAAACTADDTQDLVNGLRLPWMLVHNCLTGGFHTPGAKSMGEQWLKRVGGGAVAAYAPSGLGFRFLGEQVTETMWGDIFGPRKVRSVYDAVLGNIVDLCTFGNQEACQYYILLGDPATRLQIPSVEPPTNPAVVAGNALVDLTWDESASPGADYDVYRTTTLGVPYDKVNGSPIDGATACNLGNCAYTDATAENAKTYYYYIVGLDSEGFESAWSNFNSDCGDAMPTDCLVAQPLNPNPPNPPTGVVVVDAESGGRLDVSWNANPESDVDRYFVHWGTSPGDHPNTIDAERQTSAVITGLQNGIPHYVVVTARNSSGLESGNSSEASGTPTFVFGLKAPRFIDDLMLEKSGADLVLSWSAVTTDIYGKTESGVTYEVHRGTTPDFLPSVATLISGTGYTMTSFTDSGAASAGPDYYYLVRAVDGEGNPGGLGRQLPDGVGDLTLDKSSITPGNIVLSWSAVTQVFDPAGGGGPTMVDRYEIYASDAPFTREDIRDGLLAPFDTTTATSHELTPPAQSRYYSVIVIDNRGNASPF